LNQRRVLDQNLGGSLVFVLFSKKSFVVIIFSFYKVLRKLISKKSQKTLQNPVAIIVLIKETQINPDLGEI